MRPLLRCSFNSSMCAVLRCAFGYESFALHPIWIATSKLTDLSSQAKVANPPVDLSVSAEPFWGLGFLSLPNLRPPLERHAATDPSICSSPTVHSRSIRY